MWATGGFFPMRGIKQTVVVENDEFEWDWGEVGTFSPFSRLLIHSKNRRLQVQSFAIFVN
jgi:hypothetical protein